MWQISKSEKVWQTWQSVTSIMKCDKFYNVWQVTNMKKCRKSDKVLQMWQSVKNMTQILKYVIVWYVWQYVTKVTKCNIQNSTTNMNKCNNGFSLKNVSKCD